MLTGSQGLGLTKVGANLDFLGGRKISGWSAAFSFAGSRTLPLPLSRGFAPLFEPFLRLHGGTATF